MKTWKWGMILLPFLLGLSACGGGGGDDGGGSTLTYTGPTGAVDLDAANGAQAANLALDNVDSMSIDAQGVILPSTPAAVVQTAGESGGQLPGLTSQVRRALTLVKTGRSDASLPAGVTTSQTFPCSNGGTITVTASQADANTLTPGNFFQIAFNSCREGTSVTQGSMTLTVSAFSGDAGMTGDFTMRGSLTIPDLRVTTAGVLARMGGQLDFDQSRAGTVETGRVTGRRVVFVEGARQMQLTDFDFYERLDTATGARTYSADFTLASTEIGGAITVTTPVPFEATWYSTPTAGTLRVTGGNGAWIELVAQSNGTDVLLRWDFTDPYDGNDAGSKVVTWVDLPNTTIP